MQSSPVTGNPVYSPVMLVGQAPGDKEPVRGRPFAWTAGKTLFQWFQDACGMEENNVSAVRLYGGGLSVFPREKTTGRGPRAEPGGDCGLRALAQGRDGLAHTPAGHPRGQTGDCPVYSLSVIRSAHWALRALPLCWP